ncbi:MAG: division/cell wall cluster transcriptional repressor MraZ, partial [bacterium]
MPLFTGRFEYCIDDKGRLSIPARLREQVEKESQDPAFIVTNLQPEFLSVYAPNEFQELMDRLGRDENPQARKVLRWVSSGAETCPLDKQGRILLPEALRARAGLGRDVVILGAVKHIEIWDPAREMAERGAASG